MEERTPLDQKILDDLVNTFDSKFFKTLSEPVRFDILKFIMTKGRSDIGTIADHMPQDRSVISRHLNLMQEVGILTCEKENRHMYYEINGQSLVNKLKNITDLIGECMAHCCPSCLK